MTEKNLFSVLVAGLACVIVARIPIANHHLAKGLHFAPLAAARWFNCQRSSGGWQIPKVSFFFNGSSETGF
ncbi:MAG: hypothetical protein ABSH34_22635 [Verrucomicrobiota bacterium]|jgi:hypothetical protein